MATNAELLPVRESGWRMGFANLLRKEMGAWWRTRAWLFQFLLWLSILNGMLAMLLWGIGEERPAPAQAVEIFLILSGIALPIGGLIVGQDALIEEKQTGAAAWILSKPVSRPSVILTKLIAHGLGFLVTGVVLQGLGAYLQISAAAGRAWPAANFAAALGLVYLNLLFYLTLTLMLGALFSSRGPVLGIGFGLLFGYQLVIGLANGVLAYVGPWALVVSTPMVPTPLSVALALGQPLPTVVPIVVTALWCLLFTVVAIWGFSREEF
ncbi:MAG: ABC transporter permease subunit [Anaerolineales bacterium]|nr:ABC transporter permease subunit [Anaerolineales bacterium]